MVTHAFKLKKFIDLPNLKVMEMTSDIPFVEQRQCWAGCGELKTVVTLVGQNGAQKIRLGTCPTCGYTGYIDRPSRAWIDRYYLETWDGGAEMQARLAAEIEKRKQFVADHGSGKERETMAMVAKHDVPKDRPVLEIGCGYGRTLYQLREKGYAAVIGNENSVHRAKVAEGVFGMPVYAGAFESDAVQKAVVDKAPYGLIFSYHTMEHVYDPDEIVRVSGALQKEGDYMMISVPHMFGEFSMSVINYFPHLHSYTAEFYRRLFKKHGYTLIDNTFTDDRYLNVVARKGSHQGVGQDQRDYVSFVVEKFKRGLDLSKTGASRRLWWFRKHDIGGQARMVHIPVIGALQWRLAAARLGIEHALREPICSVEVGGVEKRFTNAPIEIQFEGNVKMFYK